MHSIPVRGTHHTSETGRPNSESLSMPNHDPSDAASEPSHAVSTSSVRIDQGNQHGDASITHPSTQTLMSPSSETTESHGDDHMDWSPPSPVLSTPNSSDSSSSSSDSETFTPIYTHLKPTNLLPLPTSSPGYLTHAHQQAMANRITHDKLLPGGAFDPALYTPVFLHDTLMLPGSLATVLGKVRTLLIQRAHVAPRTNIETSHRTPPSTSSTA